MRPKTTPKTISMIELLIILDQMLTSEIEWKTDEIKAKSLILAAIKRHREVLKKEG
tara:strand:- start:459 stop:626 length:168 start_codon:yes stop_codon:yes gene_type:complete